MGQSQPLDGRAVTVVAVAIQAAGEGIEKLPGVVQEHGVRGLAGHGRAGILGRRGGGVDRNAGAPVEDARLKVTLKLGPGKQRRMAERGEERRRKGGSEWSGPMQRQYDEHAARKLCLKGDYALGSGHRTTHDALTGATCLLPSLGMSRPLRMQLLEGTSVSLQSIFCCMHASLMPVDLHTHHCTNCKSLTYL